MRNLAVLFIHFIAVLARLLGPGGVRSLVAESLLLKHQTLILNRSRKRSPNLHASGRILAGLMALLVRPTRLEPKMGPTEMRAEIIRLHREGKMPSLDELLSAAAETRAEYREKILAARRGKKKA